MSRNRGTNWDAVSRREKGGPRMQKFREHSRDHASINQYPPRTTKADLRKMLEEAAKNTSMTTGDRQK